MKSFSVTTVLSPYGKYGAVPGPVLEAAQARGSGTHAACAAHSLGAWVLPLPLDWQGYFDSYCQWFERYVYQVIFVEKRFYDEVFYFNGQPDLGVELIDDRLMVVDLKTPSSESSTWKGQLAAYRYLVTKEYPGNWHCMSLRLDQFGGPAKAIVYDYAEDDFQAFLAALVAYRYFS